MKGRFRIYCHVNFAKIAYVTFLLFVYFLKIDKTYKKCYQGRSLLLDYFTCSHTLRLTSAIYSWIVM